MKRIFLFAIFVLLITNKLSANQQYGVRTAQDDYEKVVFLTGAAGFIGSNFLTYMFDKYPNYYFIVLDALTYAGNLDNIPDRVKNSNRFEFWYGSVTNQDMVDMLLKRSHFVVHFAAESHVTRSIFDNKSFVETDVMGTQMLMDALRKSKKTERFIHISTSEVYGTAAYEPMDEDHPLNPRSPYAAAKAGADRLVYSYCCTYDIPAVIIRPFNNYGPRQHIEKLIPRLITRALKGEKLPIHGDGSSKRDWIHVEDTARALDKVLHHANFESIKHEVINLGTEKPVSVIDIAHAVIHHLGLSKDLLNFIHDRPGQVACHISAREKAEKILGWQAEHSLLDAIPELIEWYKEHATWWEKMELIKDVPIYIQNELVSVH